MSQILTAEALKSMLSEPRELALLDVREHGIFGEGHLFFAIPTPYSRFEAVLPQLVPNPQVRLVLYDDNDGVATKAAANAEALGYENVWILEGGAAAWQAAGYTLFQGVNLPSKTFGELVEVQRHTPHITAMDLEKLRASGEDFVIVDGRPLTEHYKMSIPGGICCPNGELPLRIADIAPDPKTKIVVNCAGRTRSIIGAQILIDVGVKNPIAALENGTQGWFLAGLELEHGATAKYPEVVSSSTRADRLVGAEAFANRHGATPVEVSEVQGWLAEPERTTYVFDVRTPEEFDANGALGTVHAPGGQLIQTTDQWIGVRGARIVVVDDDDIRAPVIAGWLQQLGHEAYSLRGGLDAARDLSFSCRFGSLEPDACSTMTASELAAAVRRNDVQMIDIRPSMSYRKGHIEQAVWSIRPRIGKVIEDAAKPVVLITDEITVGALAADDLAKAGVGDIHIHEGNVGDWRAVGLEIVQTPDLPINEDCIDYLFFTHERHAGNEAAARQYLEWEVGLIDQLDEQERSVFRIKG